MPNLSLLKKKIVGVIPERRQNLKTLHSIEKSEPKSYIGLDWSGRGG